MLFEIDGVKSVTYVTCVKIVTCVKCTYGAGDQTEEMGLAQKRQPRAEEK